MKNNEIWKDIEGYEGLYQISNKGRVKSLERIIEGRWGKTFRKERLLNATYHKGYAKLGLSKNKSIKYYPLHRLIALAFIPNNENKPCINHIDCNPSNNTISNLEWVTYSENQLHAELNGRRNHVRVMNSNRLKQMHKNKDNRLKNYV
jgi:hypothetical protein